MASRPPEPDPGPSAEGSLRSAWPLVVAAFSISFVLVGGGIDTVGVFMNALARAEGWPFTTLSLGVSVGAMAGALSTLVVGAAVDRFGVRAPMAAGVGLLLAGFLVLVFMRSPWHFVAANLLLGPGFTATALLPLTVAIAVRVRERTALALGIAGAGASAGALVLAPVVQIMVETLGWRGAYLAMGTLVVLTPLPFLVLALPRGRLAAKPSSGPSRSPRVALGSPGLGPLLAVMVLPGLVTFAVSVHLMPLLAGSGHSGRVAAVALGATIGVSAVGKVAGGAMADAIGALPLLRVALLVMVGALAILPHTAAPAALAGFVVCYGLALGTQVAVLPALARQTLGEEGFGALFGLLQLGAMLAAAVGPVLVGALHDASGSYQHAVVLWCTATVAALLVTFLLRAPRAAEAGAIV